jgi:hypothetical protein
VSDNLCVEVASAIIRRELRRYLKRVDDRWRLNLALVGGARPTVSEGHK